MKKYEWYSALPPEKVWSRLYVRTEAWTSLWDQYDEHRVLTKRLSSEKFYLLKTGGMWQVHPQFPFVGTVTPWNEGSLISGNFSMPRSGWIQILVLDGMAFAAALSLGVPILTAWIAVLIFSGFLYTFGRFFGGNPGNRQSRETMRFIEENLLRE